jgi:large subunit ribosomal protein L4
MLELFDKKGKKSSKSADVPAGLFSENPNNHLLYLATIRQDANARAGSAHTKVKSEVRGGGAKPWRQKGTGRARAGSIRSPLWRGGGVMHGPRNQTNWTKNMNRKESALSIISALSSAKKANKISVIEEFAIKDGKTKELAALIKTLGLSSKSVLLIESPANPNIELVVRAAANIPNLKLICSETLNVKDILKASSIIITEAALKEIATRFEALKETA